MIPMANKCFPHGSIFKCSIEKLVRLKQGYVVVLLNEGHYNVIFVKDFSMYVKERNKKKYFVNGLSRFDA